MSNVIAPSCVGRLFPADASELRGQVQHFIASAVRHGQSSLPARRPKAIIVPHAGYDYSGPVAAAGYAALADFAGTFRRVVLAGTCHVTRVSGLLTTTADAFVTPLGSLPVDQDAVRQATRLPHVAVDNFAHAADHALAVQYPMLQLTLDECQIVPLLVSACEAAQVAEVLELLWGGDETLIIVSSDLSHYLSYDEACRRDHQSAEAIVRLDLDALGSHDACGYRAIGGLLLSARRHNLRARQVDLRNSGDICGERRSVVGYGAFVFEAASQ